MLVGANQPVLWTRKRATYPVHPIKEGLSLNFREASVHLSLIIREDRSE